MVGESLSREKKDPDDEEYRVDVMVNCDKETIKATSSNIAQPAKGRKSLWPMSRYE